MLGLCAIEQNHHIVKLLLGIELIVVSLISLDNESKFRFDTVFNLTDEEIANLETARRRKKLKKEKAKEEKQNEKNAE